MKQRAWILLYPLLWIACLHPHPLHQQRSAPLGTLSIDFPSENECVFAETRDFYVRGRFPAGTTKPGDLLIQVFRGEHPKGVPVRQLMSQVDPLTGTTPSSFVFSAYPKGIAWSGIDTTQIPDLITQPGGFYNPSNKVLVTQTYFAALVLGGCTKSFDTSFAESSGSPLLDLQSGSYTILVTGLNGQMRGFRGSKTISYGAVPKIFGRFSPAAHYNKFKAYADAQHLRMFNDLFPGYFKADLASPATYEIPARWRPNNALEVVSNQQRFNPETPVDPVNTFILYNISPNSTTQQLEIGTLLKHGLCEPTRVSFLRYDIGEPVIKHRNSLQESVSLDGKLLAMAADQRMELTRAEVHSSPSHPSANQENLWNEADPTPKTLDTDFSDGVYIQMDDVLDICGVVKPIPAEVLPVEGFPCAYTAVNRISQIRYTFRQDNSLVNTTVKEIQLARLYSGSSTPTHSLYEFLHRFQALPSEGVYQVDMECLDTRGQAVEGGYAAFKLKVGSHSLKLQRNPLETAKPHDASARRIHADVVSP